MARVKNQTRRRQEFIDAARRRIVDGGLEPVKKRTVAEEANLSPALVSYYFNDLEDLLREVYSDAIDRFDRKRRENLAELSDPAARLKQLIHAGLPVSTDDEICILLIEFAPLVRRNPVVNALRTALFERQVAMYESVLSTGAALGVFTLTDSPLAIARNIVSLEDAYGSHVVGPISVSLEESENLILSYASTACACDLSTG